MTTVSMATSSKQLVHAHTGLPYVTEFTACLLFYVKQVYLYLKSLECLTGHACIVIQSLLPRYEPACCSVCGRLLFVHWLCKFQVNSHCVCYISHAHPHTPHLHTLTHIHIHVYPHVLYMYLTYTSVHNYPTLPLHHTLTLTFTQYPDV